MGRNQVSIVITSYNYGEYLTEAIESALNQTIPCEVIVVDDGSTDNTREVCANYKVVYIYQTNHGLAHARNTGIRAAKGKYILPLDADDKLDPTFIEKTLGFDGIVRTALQTFDEEERVLHPSPYIELKDFCVNNQIFVSSMFPKEAWEKVGGFDESLKKCEDWDFWFRLLEHGYTIKTVDEPLLYYRIHKFQMSYKDMDEWRDKVRIKHQCDIVQ